MWPNPQKNVELVAYTEEILNGKLDCLCSHYQKKRIDVEKQIMSTTWGCI